MSASDEQINFLFFLVYSLPNLEIEAFNKTEEKYLVFIFLTANMEFFLNK